MTINPISEILANLMVECIDDSNVTTQNLRHFTNYGQDLKTATEAIQALIDEAVEDVLWHERIGSE